MHFSIIIDASKEKVWDTMLQDATYRQWTAAFGPGSYYEGSWETGSDIRFLAPNDKGTVDGMVSRIKENRPYELMSIEHVGTMHDGQLVAPNDKGTAWKGALENYTFTETDGKTEVKVDIDVEDEFVEVFGDMWPKGLQKLKEIAEAHG
jgi:uncharacterized protein YndB with AHSA1/START domain